MNIRHAVEAAKQHIVDLFGREEIINVGLEEVELNDAGLWQITIGFSRPWDGNVGSVLRAPVARSYKTVLISDEDERVLSVKDRTIPKAS